MQLIIYHINQILPILAQFFELVKNPEPSSADNPTQYPVLIKKEVFLCLDGRPLYHYAELSVPKTRHDNWEAQFKPAFLEDSNSVDPSVQGAIGDQLSEREDDKDEDDDGSQTIDKMDESSVMSAQQLLEDQEAMGGDQEDV